MSLHDSMRLGQWSIHTLQYDTAEAAHVPVQTAWAALQEAQRLAFHAAKKAPRGRTRRTSSARWR